MSDSGRHRNPGVRQVEEEGGGSFSHYWLQVRSKALRLVSDEPPPDTALLTEEPPERGYAEEWAEMTNLTYTQRITGFLLLMGMGVLFMLVGAMVWMRPKKFSFFMTCGNLFCLFSTTFLAGCSQQLHTMFESNRFEAACLYLVSVLLTLLSALWLRSSILCIVFALVQVACILWYALSFLPYARQTLQIALAYASMVFGPIFSVMGKGIGSCVAVLFN